MKTEAATRLGLAAYDSADFLKTEADVAGYLAAAAELAGDDPAYMAQALAVAARARNFSQLAREAGLSREGLRKALAPGGNPSYATVAKVARALGFGITFRPLR
jgi:probable addiction module antidote protein